MKKRVIQFLTLCLVTTFTFSFSAGQTIPGIHLGRLEFVRPPEGLSNGMRELRVTMPQNRGITSSFAHKVGGVSFVQVAQPTFHVESFSLQCDQNNNSAYAVINGKRYDIPLETWQLMPIVAYANSEYDAAVTLYGNRTYSNIGHSDTISALFHDAFIDKLLGIRLLQIDLLLADSIVNNYGTIVITPKDKCSLPSFNNNESPILSNYESSHYNPMKNIFISLSGNVQEQISNTVAKYGYYDSYIFTDFVDSVTGDSIKFNIVDDSLVIVGFPYYYFIRKDTTQIDTLEILCDFFNEIKKSKAFNKTDSPKSYRIFKNIEKENYQEALYWFCKYYNSISDSTKAKRIIIDKTRKLDVFLKGEFKKHYLSLPKDQQKTTIKEIEALKKDKKFFRPYLLAKYVKDNYETNTNLDFPTFDDLLIFYFYQNPIPKTIKLTELTNALREKHKLVLNLNPIVYDAALTTSQWAAFFRYAKKYHKKSWNSFVKQVEKLQYDAPEVYTPINLKNR